MSTEPEKPATKRGVGYWLRLVAFFFVTLVIGLQLAGAVGSAYRQTHPIRGAPCWTMSRLLRGDLSC